MNTVMPTNYPDLGVISEQLDVLCQQLDAIIGILEHQFGPFKPPPSSAAELARHEERLDAMYRSQEATC